MDNAKKYGGGAPSNVQHEQKPLISSERTSLHQS
jgi:hypothetical protein